MSILRTDVIRSLKILLAGSTTVVLSTLIGCTGSTDGGDASNTDFSGSEFVANGDTVGKISVNAPTSLAIGEEGNFSATIKDANGAPVANVQLACDSEAGLAITEPTTGSEFTDSFGSISGRVGCEAAGSFRFGCRMPVGGNFRDFVTVKCEGANIPGFSGFDGAAGGGLGGGSGSGGVANTGDLVLTDFSISDGGTEGSGSVDVDQDVDCGDDEKEPFEDTIFTVSFSNDSPIEVTLSSYTFKVVANGVTYGPIGLSGDLVVAGNGGSVSGIDGKITVVTGGTDTTASSKVFAGSNTTVTALGASNVIFTFNGIDSNGNNVTIKKTVNLVFSAVDNCD